eukprot:Lithocolla_globosa_v1_NODE_2376_length_2031_cov_3.865385.p1 type:complete len:268 gc:universal NODE_2376_length_2031_cov_3.865385:826-23(-)
MLSYAWANKSLAKLVKTYLDSAGIRVWFDEVNMKDNILDSMANAIEGAKAIIYLSTPQYQASRNCRLELEYAHSLGAKRIKLIMLKIPDFAPSGWLGLICGAKLYIQVSDETFSSATGELQKQLNDCLSERCLDDQPMSKAQLEDKPSMSKEPESDDQPPPMVEDQPVSKAQQPMSEEKPESDQPPPMVEDQPVSKAQQPGTKPMSEEKPESDDHPQAKQQIVSDNQQPDSLVSDQQSKKQPKEVEQEESGVSPKKKKKKKKRCILM